MDKIRIYFVSMGAFDGEFEDLSDEEVKRLSYRNYTLKEFEQRNNEYGLRTFNEDVDYIRFIQI